MKIIIDIPEETYNFIKENSSGSTAHEAIKNGTPLPKEHEKKDGAWIEQDGWDGDPYYDCPICGQSYSGDFGDPEELGWHYCPECGAHLIGIKRRETDDEPEEEEEPRIICPNCKSDRICWDGDYGHEGAIVQEYTCEDCGARIECYVEGESESDATTIETEQEDNT